MLSCFSWVQLCAIPWTVAHQAPLSMGFSRQEYWSGLPCPSLGDLPHPETESASLKSLYWQAGSLKLVPPGEPTKNVYYTPISLMNIDTRILNKILGK